MRNANLRRRNEWRTYFWGSLYIGFGVFLVNDMVVSWVISVQMVEFRCYLELFCDTSTHSLGCRRHIETTVLLMSTLFRVLLIIIFQLFQV